MAANFPYKFFYVWNQPYKRPFISKTQSWLIIFISCFNTAYAGWTIIARGLVGDAAAFFYGAFIAEYGVFIRTAPPALHMIDRKTCFKGKPVQFIIDGGKVHFAFAAIHTAVSCSFYFFHLFLHFYQLTFLSNISHFRIKLIPPVNEGHISNFLFSLLLI